MMLCGIENRAEAALVLRLNKAWRGDLRLRPGDQRLLGDGDGGASGEVERVGKKYFTLSLLISCHLWL
jgi:hypothetical protein